MADEFRKRLEDEEFATLSLADGYPRLLEKYKELDLNSGMSVEDRLVEYGYVLQQLRKFMGTKRLTTLEHADDLDWLLRYYRKMELSGQTEYPKERKELVFCIMRNQWVRHMIALVESEIEDKEEEEEEQDAEPGFDW